MRLKNLTAAEFKKLLISFLLSAELLANIAWADKRKEINSFFKEAAPL
jgi:hypothetical protein